MSEKSENLKNLWQEMSSEEKEQFMKEMMKEFMSGHDRRGGFHFMDRKRSDRNCGKDHPFAHVMEKMMGRHSGKSKMSSMWKHMMGGERPGFDPMELCGQIMSYIHENRKVSTMATPEVRGLFEDWVEQIENEIIEFLKDKEDPNVDMVAKQFKISRDSAYYFLTKLAQKGKINIKIDDWEKKD